MAVYASVDDLEDELDGDSTPAHPDRLLIRASAVIDGLVRGCVYDVDDVTGLPTDPDDIAILKRLTVLQAIHMAETGQTADYSSVRTSTVSWTRASGGKAPRVAPVVVDALLSSGFPGSGLAVRR